MSHDVIGDIHGHCEKLEALLRLLGYREVRGAWRHPSRQAIFVGDFIDRGPEQRRTVATVRRMVDAGSALAVMGNHEFNAIAWHTPSPLVPGDFLRTRAQTARGQAHRHHHRAFLDEVEDDAALHAEIVEWFLTLPLWLEVAGVRVVHACWDQASIDWLAPRLDDARLTRELMVEACRAPLGPSTDEAAGTTMRAAVGRLTKGVEVDLPDGAVFVDPEGVSRRQVRLKWWDDAATTFRAAALLPDDQRAALPATDIPVRARVLGGGAPVIFGHYWLTGVPTLASPLRACIDYSAARGGPLVACRFDGEDVLRPDSLVWVG